MVKNIYKTFIILILLLIPLISYAEEKATEKKSIALSNVSFQIIDEKITFTISSEEKIDIKKENDDGILIFKFTPQTNDSFEEIYEKGLINSFSCSGGENSKIIVRYVSSPHYEIKEQNKDNKNYIFITIYTTNVEGQNLKRKSIKTKNNYQSGESLLTDMAVILDSSSKKSLQDKARKPEGILNKVLIATEKLNFRDNIKIMISGKKPDAPKAGSGLSSLKDMIPIEKSENLNVTFNNKSLQEIIKYLADKAGKNVMISPLITGSKSIEFTDISPEEALRLLLADTGYDYRIMRNAIIAGPPDIIEKMAGRNDAFNSEEGYIKKVFVMKKRRGETVIKEFKRFFPHVSYIFHSKLNAFEIYADPDTVDHIEIFINSRDNNENQDQKTKE